MSTTIQTIYIAYKYTCGHVFPHGLITKRDLTVHSLVSSCESHMPQFFFFIFYVCYTICLCSNFLRKSHEAKSQKREWTWCSPLVNCDMNTFFISVHKPTLFLFGSKFRSRGQSLICLTSPRYLVWKMIHKQTVIHKQICRMCGSTRVETAHKPQIMLYVYEQTICFFISAHLELNWQSNCYAE